MSKVVTIVLVAGLALVGCGRETASGGYVARVGDAYLTEEDIEEALSGTREADSPEARQQVVDQWVRRTLLYQDALRQGLRDDEDVQRLLADNERSVLIDALVASLYADEPGVPTAAQVQDYFERNRDRLHLREPFAQVRYLTAASADSAALARRLLQRAVVTGSAEAAWRGITDRFALDPEGARVLSASYFPERQLFADQGAVREALAQLDPGQLAPVIPLDSAFAVLQLADRAPEGTEPRLEWIEADIRRRLTIEARKQMVERHVQRLRNEAQTRDALDVLIP